MSKTHPPQLKEFMDKKLSLQSDGDRHVQGLLQDLNSFMHTVIDEYVEMVTRGQQNNSRIVVV
ncbi:small nuclear ribonucleoprotein G-like [Microtus oregoni]|uniref:small nuclear ribonucleoprotein G-like n=1 Tax=Microtus oregoni TaxID=111838 RepID=UPI001BB1EBF2|nr:small nuclear ribonucleoprotein G-like [Microtus oregoni]